MILNSFLKKIIFLNRYVEIEAPPPLCKKLKFLNFHCDYWIISLICTFCHIVEEGKIHLQIKCKQVNQTWNYIIHIYVLIANHHTDSGKLCSYKAAFTQTLPDITSFRGLVLIEFNRKRSKKNYFSMS